MAKPNALVDRISTLSAPTETLTARMAAAPPRVTTVQFHGGQYGLLDTAGYRERTWAEILESLRQANQPVYVEIDPETHVITELLLPRAVNVGAITPITDGDGVQVELIVSQARHYLRRDNSEFEELLKVLRSAREEGSPVLVTETDAHDIIDVRPFPKPPGSAEQTAPPASPASDPTPQQAQQLFDLVNGKICCPGSASAPCIPFLYPDDGCWARAHEMCRLIIAAGVQPAKVWIYGNLNAATHNNPACHVNWGWHVAPTLPVNVGGSMETWVIDPSLFNGPVRQDMWGSVQGDPSAVLEASDASVYHRGQGGTYVSYDPTYTQTQADLDSWGRIPLKLRTAGPSGPPPYFQCLTQPPGVQWFGTIAGGDTHRWYTWGWPAAWHVFWTIMPLTPCPGAPQLSWTVAVERANAAQCTYWITVKNLTSDPVRFEGRYDLLSH
jgi:hypothetical protein